VTTLSHALIHALHMDYAQKLHLTFFFGIIPRSKIPKTPNPTSTTAI
jgi:hypothetical protein